MQPQLFYTSTAADRGTLLSAAVPMVRALTRGGAAMFTRSTPGCGTLDGPSLAWAASLWPKPRRYEGSPCLRLPSADGQLKRLAPDFRMVYAQYIPGISRYIPGISCLEVKHDFWVQMRLCPEMPCCIYAFALPPTSIAPLKAGET